MAERNYEALRVLRYIGPRDWVGRELANRSVKGVYYFQNGARIEEAVLGQSPEAITYNQIREMLKKHLAEAQDFFPDDDSKREGYLAALEFLLQELPL